MGVGPDRRDGSSGGGLLRFRRTDARPDGALPTDARRGRERREESGDGFWRKPLRWAFLVLLAGGVALAVFGEGGWLDSRASRQELAARQAELEEQYARVMALRREVERLKTDPAAIERIAREQLGFIRPGEIVFLVPEGEAP